MLFQREMTKLLMNLDDEMFIYTDDILTYGLAEENCDERSATVCKTAKAHRPEMAWNQVSLMPEGICICGTSLTVQSYPPPCTNVARLKRLLLHPGGSSFLQIKAHLFPCLEINLYGASLHEPGSGNWIQEGLDLVGATDAEPLPFWDPIHSSLSHCPIPPTSHSVLCWLTWVGSHSWSPCHAQGYLYPLHPGVPAELVFLCWQRERERVSAGSMLVLPVD